MIATLLLAAAVRILPCTDPSWQTPGNHCHPANSAQDNYAAAAALSVCSRHWDSAHGHWQPNFQAECEALVNRAPPSSPEINPQDTYDHAVIDRALTESGK